MKQILPVILCGGSGSRLWPLSRKNHPKQFLPLMGEQSLLQQTLSRLDGLAELLSPMVICNDVHRFMVAEQLQALETTSRILLEPCSRNTAPAAAAAAFLSDLDTLLLLLPADHQIKHPFRFQEAVREAVILAEEDYLVSFGVKPGYAETGYGYIRRGEKLEGAAFRIQQFVEKPDSETALNYVQSGEYDWNSGMFLFKASAYLSELQQFSPAIYEACKQAAAFARKDLDFIRLEKSAFESSESLSIDYAVMEKTGYAAVVPLAEDCGWSDLGSWDAIYNVSEKNKDGNVCKGDVHTLGVTDSYLHAESRLLAVVGVRDHIVVETPDAVLVAHKEAAQDVKQIVAKLETIQRGEAEVHRRVYRPWGCYEVMDSSDAFQVKRISVKPGASLSLQMHHHRSEHWVVVQGKAMVICGEREFVLKENESTYIPAGSRHRLSNQTEEPLVIIEVQTGSYLGEDDIVRFEDSYGREAEVC